jgi:AcrR family transcriptional regulator
MAAREKLGAEPAAPKIGTRERIYTAAVELIAEQGYAATTVEDIAARAEVAKGTVFYNFGSKHELFEHLLNFGVGQLTGRMRAAAEGRSGSEAFIAVFDAVLVNATAAPAFLQLLFTEMYRTGGAWQDTLLLVRAQILGVIREIIVAGQESGEFRPEIDAETASAGAMGALAVAILDWLAYHPQTPVSAMRDSVGGLLLGGLVR